MSFPTKRPSTPSGPNPDAELAKALCAIEDNLSEWEVEFVESIAKQVEAGRRLSARQREIAERIEREKGA